MRLSSKPISISLLLLLLSSFTGGLAQAQQAAIATAASSADRTVILQTRALLALGDRDSACEVISAYEGARGVEGNFLTGMCARRSGDLDGAIGYFRAALARDPDLTRARLELARTLFQSKRWNESRRQFELALESSPPANVESNIRRFLAALEGRKDWNLRLTAGVLYDDNVNSGPASGEILLFDTPFILDADSLQQDTLGLLFGISGDYTLVISDQAAWRFAAGGSKLEYRDHTDFEIGVVSAATGPLWRGDDFIAGLDGIYQRVWLGNGGYSHSYGVRPSFNYALGRKTTLVTTAAFEKRKFDGRPARDGERYYGGVAVRFTVSGIGVLQPGYRFSKVEASDGTEGFGRHEISLNGVFPIGDRWSARAATALWLSRYDALEPAFGVIRDDTLWRGNLALIYAFTSLRMALTLSYSYARNDSNITVFDYDRHQMSLSVTKRY